MRTRAVKGCLVREAETKLCYALSLDAIIWTALVTLLKVICWSDEQDEALNH